MALGYQWAFDLDLYSVLGLEESARDDQINDAYKVLARQTHPDKGGSEERFRLINAARSILTDPDARRQYSAAQPLNDLTRRPLGSAD